MKNTTKQGFIYAIQAEHVRLIKIGYSKNPHARLLDLQTGSAVRLALLAFWAGTMEDESALHARFNSHRSHGEWFFPAPGLVRLISQKGGRAVIAGDSAAIRPSPIRGHEWQRKSGGWVLFRSWYERESGGRRKRRQYVASYTDNAILHARGLSAPAA